MKKLIFLLAASLISATTVYGGEAPIVDPGQPSPVPEPPSNITVSMNINMGTEICRDWGNGWGCGATSITFPREKKIELFRGMSSCMNCSKNDTPITAPAPYIWKGHWIDLDESNGRRYIGIITISRYMNKDMNGKEEESYSLVAEIQGPTKLLAKMSTSFGSWNQLHDVTLFGDKIELGNSATETPYLSFGPWVDTTLPLPPPSSHAPTNLEKPVWTVEKGTLRN